MAAPPALLPFDLKTLIQMDSSALKSALLDLICQVAYREGDFGLTSGQRSSYYINGKQVTLHPQGALMVGRLLQEHIPAEVAAVAGLTLGADPIVTSVSLVGAYCDRILYPLIVRKEAKGHGTQAYIEGIALPTGSEIAVLEDVVTTGGSALKAVERLRAAGYQVNQVVTLVDRQEGGSELYQAQGLNFSALYTIQDIQARWAQLRSASPTP